MIAVSSSSTYVTGDNYSDGGTAATAWLPIRVEVVYISSWNNNAPAPTEHVFESPLQRRRRLSLEAVARFRRAARRFVQRITSIWRRPVTVARVCAQSERWRVLA